MYHLLIISSYTDYFKIQNWCKNFNSSISEIYEFFFKITELIKNWCKTLELTFLCENISKIFFFCEIYIYRWKKVQNHVTYENVSYWNRPFWEKLQKCHFLWNLYQVYSNQIISIDKILLWSISTEIFGHFSSSKVLIRTAACLCSCCCCCCCCCLSWYRWCCLVLYPCCVFLEKRIQHQPRILALPHCRGSSGGSPGGLRPRTADSQSPASVYLAPRRSR